MARKNKCPFQDLMLAHKDWKVSLCQKGKVKHRNPTVPRQVYNAAILLKLKWSDAQQCLEGRPLGDFRYASLSSLMCVYNNNNNNKKLLPMGQYSD